MRLGNLQGKKCIWLHSAGCTRCIAPTSASDGSLKKLTLTAEG